jgi:phosphotransferase system  glucose/maltose/N-acetylglucosamine-specific IIC component
MTFYFHPTGGLFMNQKIGSMAFMAGFVIAVLVGIAQAANSVMDLEIINADVAGIIALVLVILGLVVGYMNIKDKHITDFLIATVAVAIIGLVALNPATGVAAVLTSPIVVAINSIVGNIVTLVAPAALVVGLKQIMALSKEQVI